MSADSRNSGGARFAIGETVAATVALNMRRKAGIGGDMVRLLPSGTRGEILAGPVESGDYFWWEISTSDGSGWVAGDWLRAADQPGTEYATGTQLVTTDAINLRSGAGTAHPVRYLLPSGTPAMLLEGPVANNGYDWYRVETGQFGTGWLVADFVRNA